MAPQHLEIKEGFTFRDLEIAPDVIAWQRPWMPLLNFAFGTIGLLRIELEAAVVENVLASCSPGW
jgi:hypothetical protein